jgi:hypothetical protein
MNKVVSGDIIESIILVIRGQKVILDKDLAVLYGVPTKRLNEQVRRNRRRFPEDFMFQLTKEEVSMCQDMSDRTRSQFATLKRGGNIKYLPYVFTEQGVAMLSGVLNSDRAIAVNIAIMRAFVRLRRILAAHKKIESKLKEHDQRLEKHDEHIYAIFEAIKGLMEPPPEPPPEPPKRKIGFHEE